MNKENQQEKKKNLMEIDEYNLQNIVNNDNNNIYEFEYEEETKQTQQNENYPSQSQPVSPFKKLKKYSQHGIKDAESPKQQIFQDQNEDIQKKIQIVVQSRNIQNQQGTKIYPIVYTDKNFKKKISNFKKKCISIPTVMPYTSQSNKRNSFGLNLNNGRKSNTAQANLYKNNSIYNNFHGKSSPIHNQDQHTFYSQKQQQQLYNSNNFEDPDTNKNSNYKHLVQSHETFENAFQRVKTPSTSLSTFKKPSTSNTTGAQKINASNSPSSFYNLFNNGQQFSQKIKFGVNENNNNNQGQFQFGVVKTKSSHINQRSPLKKQIITKQMLQEAFENNKNFNLKKKFEVDLKKISQAQSLQQSPFETFNNLDNQNNDNNNNQGGSNINSNRYNSYCDLKHQQSPKQQNTKLVVSPYQQFKMQKLSSKGNGFNIKKQYESRFNEDFVYVFNDKTQSFKKIQKNKINKPMSQISLN